MDSTQRSQSFRKLVESLKHGNIDRRQVMTRAGALGAGAALASAAQPLVSGGFTQSGRTSIASANIQDTVTLDWANDAAWHEAGQEALGEAASAEIGVGIESVFFPDSDAFQAAVRSSLESDEAFPVFDWWSGYRMRDLVDAGLVADLTSLWEEHIAAGEYPQTLMNQFALDGRAYGAPKLVNYWAVFYNKHVFDDHGLTPPTTWDELVAIADTLKAEGITPFGQDVVGCRWCSFIWFEELLIRTDPQLYEALVSGGAAYNDPGVAEAMNVWSDLIERGYFSEPGAVTGEQLPQSLLNGEIGMYLIGDWWTVNLERAGAIANTDYGVFVMPGISEAGNRSLIIEARPVMVAEQSAEKENALALVDYLMGPEGQTAWATAGDVNSPNLKIAADTRPQHLVALSDSVGAGDYDLHLRYWEATPPEISDQVVDLLGRFVLEPGSQEEVLDQATAIADEFWAEEQARRGSRTG